MALRTKLIPAYILIVLCLLVLVGCQDEKNALDRVQEAGVLRVGLDPTYPPFEFLVGEDVEGIDVDLTNAIADLMGLSVDFVYFGYDGLYDALATDQVDILASALVIVPSRLEDFEYSNSYFNAGQVIVSTPEVPLQSPGDVMGKKIAVELGAQGHVEALTWQRRFEDLDIMPYNSATEAIDAVVRRDVDGAVVDHVSARLYVGVDEGRIQLSTAVTDEPYAIVVNAGEEELLETINSAIEELEQTGEIRAIHDRWFSK